MRKKNELICLIRYQKNSNTSGVVYNIKIDFKYFKNRLHKLINYTAV